MERARATVGNEACAAIACQLSDVIATEPITQPAIVQRAMDRFAALTGRAHSLFEDRGSPDAESVIVIMGSGAETVAATVDALGSSARVGVLTVKLHRPFSVDHFLAALPPTVRSIAVLDRTKEPGAIGEPLYRDVVTALHEGAGVAPFRVIGGRYGLGSKEFTPAMVQAVFAELANSGDRHDSAQTDPRPH